jgi:Flp pilus assembly protein TadG
MLREKQTAFVSQFFAPNTLLNDFRPDQDGNVAIIFCLMATVLMLAVGAAVDVGRWLHARDQTVAAVDAALLAGGRALQANATDEGAAIAAAQQFYTQNTATRLPVVSDSVAFAIGNDGISMIANGTAYIQTPFLQLANIDKLPLIAEGQQPIARAQLAVSGGNGSQIQSLEISVMLDVTGSMAGQKLQDLKDSASDLINIVLLNGQNNLAVKVGIVPFSEDIRLPNTAALNKARGTSNLPLTKSITTGSGRSQKTTKYYLSDCVVERTGNEKYSDAAPASGQYVMAHYTTSSSGGKGVCTVPSSAAIAPLTSDKNSLLTIVSNLKAAGGTAGHLGTAWAWYLLSPNWASLWPSSTPAPYGTETVQKIAILMTDGEYNTQYDSNGISVNQNSYPSCSSAANGCSTTQARALCAAMKQQGIKIYTIGFDLGGNQTAVDTLTQCATTPAKPTDPVQFYNVTSGVQLKQAFRDIALKLTSLHLSM